MNSTRGRPRTLSNAQVQYIMAWYHSPRSIRALALSMGVNKSTVDHCIRLGGRYKQSAPEDRAETLRASRTRMKCLRRDGWL